MTKNIFKKYQVSYFLESLAHANLNDANGNNNDNNDFLKV